MLPILDPRLRFLAVLAIAAALTVAVALALTLDEFSMKWIVFFVVVTLFLLALRAVVLRGSQAIFGTLDEGPRDELEDESGLARVSGPSRGYDLEFFLKVRLLAVLFAAQPLLIAILLGFAFGDVMRGTLMGLFMAFVPTAGLLVSWVVFRERMVAGGFRW